MAAIRPKDLPPGVPAGSASLIFDSGTQVLKSTPLLLVDAATPLASQADAETGTDNVMRMTPLRTAQAIAVQSVSSATLSAALTANSTGDRARANHTGTQPVSTLSNLSAANTPSTAGNVQTDINARPTSATLAAVGGAALIGSTGPSTVQADITARPTSAILAASGGAALIGNSGGGTVQDAIFVKGPAAAVVPTTAKIDWKREPSAPTYPVQGMAGLWIDKVSWNTAISAEFDAANAPVNTPFAAPAATLLVAMHNKGTDATALALQTISGLHSSNREASAANFIVYSQSGGLTGAKMKGVEIDIQPHSSTTIAEAFGLGIVAFVKELPGDAIHISNNGAGYFTSGIRIDTLNSSTGAGLYATGNLGALINTGAATYGQDAIIVSNLHKQRFAAASGNDAKLFVDGSNFFHFVMPDAGIVFRNPTDLSSLVFIDPTGNVDLQAGGTLKFTGALSVPTATAGVQSLPSNPVGFLVVSIAGTNRKIPYYAN